MAEPKRGALLTLFLIINALTVIVAVGVIIALILVLALSNNLSNVEFAVRVYAIVFCIGIILAELEWPSIMKNAVLLRWWPVRGLLYTFVGLLTLEISDFNDNPVAEAFHYIFGWILVGVGVLYFFMGLARLHKVRDDKQTAFEQSKATSMALDAQQPQPAPSHA